MKNVQRFEGTDWRQLLPGPEVELRDTEPFLHTVVGGGVPSRLIRI